MNTTTEETVECWSHGKLGGVWEPTANDMNHIYSPLDIIGSNEDGLTLYECVTAYFYRMRELTLPMLSEASLRYNAVHRVKCFRKMQTMDWDDALLSAFHNFQFACYMADVAPSFYNMAIPVVSGNKYTCQPGILGKEIFLLKMLYETASEVVGPTFRRNKQECRISTIYNNETSSVIGLQFHVVRECLINLTVRFNPLYNPVNKTYRCEFGVYLDAETWYGDVIPLYSDYALKSEYIELTKKLRLAIKSDLTAFKKKLKDADFNQPGNMPDDMR